MEAHVLKTVKELHEYRKLFVKGPGIEEELTTTINFLITQLAPRKEVNKYLTQFKNQ